ncbi:MAG: diguanylate cyclase [Chitinispirillales bacterium]|jgi:diguanylate cyclase (GGDEF)-like protein|nr:diguanylate cyclase [Chitinispirillales bacterium]
MTDNSGKKIIIVDDNITSLTLAREMLKPFYTVYPAPSAQRLFEALERVLPDLILLDVEMPQMNGYEAIKILKADERFTDIPVIFLTAKTDTDSELEGFELGAVDYVTKPFHPSIIKARIETHLKIVEQRHIIEQLSLIDTLTRIPNRRSFDKQTAKEWRHAIRERKHLSLIMIDADNFKSFNDIYGHQQGDLVLQTLAYIIESSIRRVTDTVARWGGEEFVVLLPNTNADGAMSVAENIRKNIEKTPIQNLCDSSQELHISASMGVASIEPTDSSSIEEFIKQADEALYRAKETGKNRVCLYTVDIPG